jgi:hypothetical protein
MLGVPKDEYEKAMTPQVHAVHKALRNWERHLPSQEQDYRYLYNFLLSDPLFTSSVTELSRK